MNPYFRTHKLSAILSASLMLALPLLSLSASAGTVSAPYVNDFSTSVSDFVAAPAARWTHLPALGVYSNYFKYFSMNTPTTASVNAGNMGGLASVAKPFTYTVDFTLISGDGTSSYLGVCFLSGTDSLPATDGYTFYQMMRATPSLKRNNVVVATGTSFNQLRYLNGRLLRFNVQGVYVDTDADGIKDALDITAKMTDTTNGNTSTLTYRDTTPLTGSFFGMKSYDANTLVSAVNWDSFSISNDTPKYTLIAIR